MPVVFFCKTCSASNSSYKVWITHLLSAFHQSKTKSVIKKWSRQEKNRAVIFSELPTHDIQTEGMTKLAVEVSKDTIVSDFYYDLSKQICIVLVDEKKGANFIVSRVHVSTDGRSLRKRLVSEIPSSEWNNIFPREEEQSPIASGQ